MKLYSGIEKIDKQNFWTKMEKNIISKEPRGDTKKIEYKHRITKLISEIWTSPIQLEFRDRYCKQRPELFFRQLLPMYSFSPSFCDHVKNLKEILVTKITTEKPKVEYIIRPYNPYLAAIMLQDAEGKWQICHVRDPYDQKGYESVDEYLNSKGLGPDWKKIPALDENSQQQDSSEHKVFESESNIGSEMES